MGKFSLTTLVIFALVAIAGTAMAVVVIPTPDIDQITDDLYYLASDDLEGRMTGSEGAENAAEYIKDSFESNGLIPGDSSDGDYYQEFEITKSVSPGDDNSLEITTPDGVTSLTLDEDFQPLFLSTNGEVSGDVVFAGYGITAPEYEWDDYDGLDVDGKIVLVLKDEPGRDDPESVFNGENPTKYSGLFRKARNAADHGAVAILVSPGPAFDNEENDLSFQGYGELLGTNVTTIPIVQISIETADILFSTMDAPLSMYQGEIERHGMAFGAPLENVTVDLDVDLDREYLESWNVAGILPGSDPDLADEYVIIGAHYDHLGYGLRSDEEHTQENIHNGADDNASGVSALLELVRMFANADTAPKRSILFISFCGEELGRLGSKAYIDDPLVPLEVTSAMLNMDMVGRIGANEDGNLVAMVHGLGSAEEWGDIVPYSTPGGQVLLETQDSMVVGSDFQSFYDAGIPVLNFFSGIHSDYHKPTDDADKINFAGIGEICETVYSVASKVANNDSMLAFHDWDTPVEINTEVGAMPSYTVYVGTMPDFSKLEDGYFITGVTPGSPAEQAGLQSGDQIIKVGDYDVDDMMGYMTALGNYNPGDTVDVVVLRDGEEITLTVTFTERE